MQSSPRLYHGATAQYRASKTWPVAVSPGRSDGEGESQAALNSRKSCSVHSPLYSPQVIRSSVPWDRRQVFTEGQRRRGTAANFNPNSWASAGVRRSGDLPVTRRRDDPAAETCAEGALLFFYFLMNFRGRSPDPSIVFYFAVLECPPSVHAAARDLLLRVRHLGPAAFSRWPSRAAGRRFDGNGRFPRMRRIGASPVHARGSLAWLGLSIRLYPIGQRRRLCRPSWQSRAAFQGTGFSLGPHRQQRRPSD